MSMLRDIRGKLGWHRWGPVTGDVAGAHHQCTYCDKVRSVDTGRPPDAQDQQGIHF
ncbi:MAG: hypothetical protein LH468_09050 [Nocardioides sp.]|nr:hypothetical protein [Nocardioides sp.]